MKWQDNAGTRWRLSQTRLAWPRLVKPEIAANLFPDGLGDDPISLIIALPGLAVLAVLLPVWLAELAVRLVLAPFVMLLRLMGVVPYLVRLRRNGKQVNQYRITGYGELKRTRVAVIRDTVQRGQRPDAPVSGVL